MEIEEDHKEVYFGEYCQTCKHKDIVETEDPCNECLEYPVNLYSHRPVNWKGAKGYEDYTAPVRGEGTEG